jgi:hypothetical protein
MPLLTPFEVQLFRGMPAEWIKMRKLCAILRLFAVNGLPMRETAGPWGEGPAHRRDTGPFRFCRAAGCVELLLRRGDLVQTLPDWSRICARRSSPWHCETYESLRPRTRYPAALIKVFAIPNEIIVARNQLGGAWRATRTAPQSRTASLRACLADA